MTDLVAVAAYGKVQGLTNDECWKLWLRWNVPAPKTLRRMDALILDIKRARQPAPRPEPHTHEEWREGRQ